MIKKSGLLFWLAAWCSPRTAHCSYMESAQKYKCLHPSCTGSNSLCLKSRQLFSEFSTRFTCIARVVNCWTSIKSLFPYKMKVLKAVFMMKWLLYARYFANIVFREFIKPPDSIIFPFYCWVNKGFKKLNILFKVTVSVGWSTIPPNSRGHAFS